MPKNLRLQIKAARALLEWDQRTLSKMSGVTPATIGDLELGMRTPAPATRQVILLALDKAGVELFDAVAGVHGAGVRWKWHGMEEPEAGIADTEEKSDD